MMHTSSAAVLATMSLLLAVPPTVLVAQTITGRVVDSVSRRPMPHVAVRLVPSADTARDTVFAVAETAADGVFVLSAPAPGSYRVRIGPAHLGPPMRLATADTTVAYEYQVGALPIPDAPTTPAPGAVESADRVYTEKETGSRARMLHGGPAPSLPSDLVEHSAPGRAMQ